MSQNPYQAPLPATLTPADASQLYNQLPWYRKSSIVSWLTVLGLCCSPSMMLVCVIVLTGPVYYNKADTTGNLKKWGNANKVVAVLILVFQVLAITAQLASIAQQNR